MPLQSALARVLSEYQVVVTQPFAKHPLAAFLRGDAPAAVNTALGSEAIGLISVGSPGAGNWAEVPWLAVFDPLVTDTATRGYYVVYLFHTAQRVLYLSLNQGTTIVRQEFANAARQVLADRAEFMRRRLSDVASLLPATSIDLGSNARLPGDYAAGHALGIRYELDNLPGNEQLGVDLRNAVRAYRALTFRGGLDTDVDPDTSGIEIPRVESLIEVRRYRLHARIERNPKAVREAKKHHGTRCQVCAMSFADVYGAIGDGFIEAHHLRPIASLEEGVPVQYDVGADFAVLCSNCHRMIHRTENPSDIRALRQALTR